jgi:zinc resistance-associated protein
MQKTIIIIATVASILLISSQAFACPWDGYWGGPMGGPMGGFYSSTYSGGAYQGFFDRTAKTRQDLAGKRAEYDALMANSNPDPERAAALNREITALNQQLSAQARSYSLPIPSGNYGNGYGRMGRGYGMGGYGCW